MTRRIVVDANILVRAVLGKRVRETVAQFATNVQFFTPDCCFDDAYKYLPALFVKRHLPIQDKRWCQVPEKAKKTARSYAKRQFQRFC